MAHQAVDLGHIGKIKIGVFPPIAGVTTGATSLVADDADSEVFRGNGGFTELDLLSMMQGVWGRPFPQPVGRLEHIFAGRGVAAQAFTGDLGGFKYAFTVADRDTIDIDHFPPPLLVHPPQTPSTVESVFVSTGSTERQQLIAALHSAAGNQSQAARMLGINRVTVWNRMRKYGIDLKCEIRK